MLSLCRYIFTLVYSQVLQEAVFTYTLKQLNRCQSIQNSVTKVRIYVGTLKTTSFAVVENSLESDNDTVQNTVIHVKSWFYELLLARNIMLNCCQYQMLVTSVKLLRD